MLIGGWTKASRIEFRPELFRANSSPVLITVWRWKPREQRTEKVESKEALGRELRRNFWKSVAVVRGGLMCTRPL